MMLDIQQKRKVRSFLYHRGFLAVLFVVVLFALHSTWSVYRKKELSLEMKNISLNQVEDLRKRNDDLDKKINKLTTDVGIEEEIRSKFSVAKEGESVVVVVQDEQKAASSTKSHASFWSKLISVFK